jgi:hypothetical protein
MPVHPQVQLLIDALGMTSLPGLDAGVAAEVKRYAGMPHGFFSFGAALDGTKEATADAVLHLRSAFGREAVHAATAG